MKYPLFWKFGTLFLLMLLLMIPLAMVQSTNHDRSMYQSEVRQDIAASWGGVQRLVGPFIVQTWHEPVESKVWDKNLEAYVQETSWPVQRRVVFPENLDVQGKVMVEQRYRGIYTVPVYRADMTVDANFDIPAMPANARNPHNQLVIAISDTRGFRAQPVLTWLGEPLPVTPGTNIAMPNGVHAVVPANAIGLHALRAQLALGGSSELSIAPLGGDTRIALESNWPHPGFKGGYLPENRDISAAGFTADWQTSHFATTVRPSVSDCVSSANCGLDDAELISLALMDPIDVYVLNDRSTKYGVLFLLVVFGIFVIYELLKRMRIHPVQYLLVGLGQALFFLLLLSLSEHIAFGLAYLAGAAACILLLSFYVSRVLDGWRAGWRFGSLLSVVYGSLYVILQSEDYALLLGSILLFILLAAAMFLTRNIDWYAIGRTSSDSNGDADERKWQKRVGQEETS